MKIIEKGYFKSGWSLPSFLTAIYFVGHDWDKIDHDIIFLPYFLPLRTNIRKQSMGHFAVLFFP